MSDILKNKLQSVSNKINNVNNDLGTALTFQQEADIYANQMTDSASKRLAIAQDIINLKANINANKTNPYSMPSRNVVGIEELYNSKDPFKTLQKMVEIGDREEKRKQKAYEYEQNRKLRDLQLQSSQLALNENIENFNLKKQTLKDNLTDQLRQKSLADAMDYNSEDYQTNIGSKAPRRGLIPKLQDTGVNLGANAIGVINSGLDAFDTLLEAGINPVGDNYIDIINNADKNKSKNWTTSKLNNLRNRLENYRENGIRVERSDVLNVLKEGWKDDDTSLWDLMKYSGSELVDVLGESALDIGAMTALPGMYVGAKAHEFAKDGIENRTGKKATDIVNSKDIFSEIPKAGIYALLNKLELDTALSPFRGLIKGAKGVERGYKFGLGKSLGTGLLKGTGTGFTEGFAEKLQSDLELMNNPTLTASEKAKASTEAGILGAMVGGALGTGHIVSQPFKDATKLVNSRMKGVIPSINEAVNDKKAKAEDFFASLRTTVSDIESNDVKNYDELQEAINNEEYKDNPLVNETKRTFEEVDKYTTEVIEGVINGSIGNIKEAVESLPKLERIALVKKLSNPKTLEKILVDMLDPEKITESNVSNSPDTLDGTLKVAKEKLNNLYSLFESLKKDTGMERLINLDNLKGVLKSFGNLYDNAKSNEELKTILEKLVVSTKDRPSLTEYITAMIDNTKDDTYRSNVRNKFLGFVNSQNKKEKLYKAVVEKFKEVNDEFKQGKKIFKLDKDENLVETEEVSGDSLTIHNGNIKGISDILKSITDENSVFQEVVSKVHNYTKQEDVKKNIEKAKSMLEKGIDKIGEGKSFINNVKEQFKKETENLKTAINSSNKVNEDINDVINVRANNKAKANDNVKPNDKVDTKSNDTKPNDTKQTPKPTEAPKETKKENEPKVTTQGSVPPKPPTGKESLLKQYTNRLKNLSIQVNKAFGDYVDALKSNDVNKAKRSKRYLLQTNNFVRDMWKSKYTNLGIVLTLPDDGNKGINYEQAKNIWNSKVIQSLLDEFEFEWGSTGVEENTNDYIQNIAIKPEYKANKQISKDFEDRLDTFSKIVANMTGGKVNYNIASTGSAKGTTAKAVTTITTTIPNNRERVRQVLDKVLEKMNIDSEVVDIKTDSKNNRIYFQADKDVVESEKLEKIAKVTVKALGNGVVNVTNGSAISKEFIGDGEKLVRSIDDGLRKGYLNDERQRTDRASGEARYNADERTAGVSKQDREFSRNKRDDGRGDDGNADNIWNRAKAISTAWQGEIERAKQGDVATTDTQAIKNLLTNLKNLLGKNFSNIFNEYAKNIKDLGNVDSDLYSNLLKEVFNTIREEAKDIRDRLKQEGVSTEEANKLNNQLDTLANTFEELLESNALDKVNKVGKDYQERALRNDKISTNEAIAKRKEKIETLGDRVEVDPKGKFLSIFNILKPRNISMLMSNPSNFASALNSIFKKNRYPTNLFHSSIHTLATTMDNKLQKEKYYITNEKSETAKKHFERFNNITQIFNGDDRRTAFRVLAIESIKWYLNSSINTNKDFTDTRTSIAEMFNLDSIYDVPKDMVYDFMKSEYLYKASESIGRELLNSLGYKHNKLTSSNEELSLIQQEIGILALETLNELGYIKIKPYTYKELVKAFGEDNVFEGVNINIVQKTRKSLVVPKNTSLAFKAMNDVSENLLEADKDSGLKTYSTTKPKDVSKENIKVKRSKIYKVNNFITRAYNTLRSSAYMLPNKEEVQKIFDNEYFINAIRTYAGYENNLERIPPELRENVIAKNETIQKDIDAIKEFIKSSDSNGKIYFRYALLKTLRWELNSNTINPQISKLHRFLFVPNGAKDVTYSMDNLTAFYQLTAQAFGFGIDKESTANAIEIGQKLTEIRYKELSKKFMAQKPIEITLDNGTKVEVKVNHPTHTLQGILAVKHLQEAKAKGESSFTTTLTGEVDAVTSGIHLKSFQFMIHPRVLDILKKTGATLGKKAVKRLNDAFADGSLVDLYKTVAGIMSDMTNVSDILEKVKSRVRDFDAYDGDTETYKDVRYKIFGQYLGGNLPDHKREERVEELKRTITDTAVTSYSIIKEALKKDPEGLVTKAGRNLGKPLVMGSSYSQGIDSVSEDLAYDVFEKLLKDAYLYFKTKDAEKKEAYDKLNFLFQVTNQDLDSIFKDENRSVFETPILHSSYTTFISYLIAVSKEEIKPLVTDALEQTFPFYSTMNSVLNKLGNDALDKFIQRYNSAKEEFKEKNKRNMTAMEEEKLLESLEDIYPGFRIVSSTEDDVGHLGVYKEKREHRRDDAMITSTTNSRNKNITQQRSINPAIKTFADAGVAHNVISIQHIDGHNIALVWVGNESNIDYITAIHDALVISAHKAVEINREFNKASYENSLKYNLFKAFADTMEKVDKDHELLPSARLLEVVTEHNKKVVNSLGGTYNNISAGLEGAEHIIEPDGEYSMNDFITINDEVMFSINSIMYEKDTDARLKNIAKVKEFLKEVQPMLEARHSETPNVLGKDFYGEKKRISEKMQKDEEVSKIVKESKAKSESNTEVKSNEEQRNDFYNEARVDKSNSNDSSDDSDLSQEEKQPKTSTTQGKFPNKILSIDKLGKDEEKAQWANSFIGYGVEGSSTAQYEKDMRAKGYLVNDEIEPNIYTRAFVSVNGKGKEGAIDKKDRDRALFKTVDEILEVLTKGGLVIMDNTTNANSPWNVVGEGYIQNKLLSLGYTRTEVTINGKKYNVFSYPAFVKPKVNQNLLINEAKDLARHNHYLNLFVLRVSSGTSYKFKSFNGEEFTLDKEHHFGNPFVVSGIGYDTTQDVRKVANASEATDMYVKWLNGEDYQDVAPERRKWILERIDNGDLDNATLIYYKTQNDTKKNHALALAEFIKEKRTSHMQKENIQREADNVTEPFGVNYPQFYHKGKEAVSHLLKVKQGQVQGAFYRKELGDIDLVWGEVTDKNKHKGYGLSHILDKHPNFPFELLDNIISTGELIGNNKRYRIEKDNYVVGITEEYKGKSKTWVITAFERNGNSQTFTDENFTSESDNLSDNHNNNESISQNDDKNPKPKVSVYKGNWTREEVKAEKDRIYVFGDNNQDFGGEYVPTTTQALIRGLDNARGIITKRDRKKTKKSYFDDSQFIQFKEDLESTIRYLKWKSLEGKEIVFPNGGLGTGKAELATKAPKIFAYLNQRLLEEFGFDNVKGELVNGIITNQDKGDDNGSTRLQDNDKTISEGVSGSDKHRSSYSSRERESRISNKERDRTYQRGRFKRVREELFPNRQEAKRRNVFQYYASKIEKITEEEVGRYLDSIFPDSKIKDILYHGTSFIFDKFDSKFLDRQRKDQSESKEILDSSLAFFATDDIINASYYSIRSKDFYFKRLRNSFEDLVKKPNKDSKEFYKYLSKLKYLRDYFEDISNIRELDFTNIADPDPFFGLSDNEERIISFLKEVETEFEEMELNEEEHTNILYYSEIVLKEIENIETAINNGNLSDYNILNNPDRERLTFSINREPVVISKDKNSIYLQIGLNRSTLNKDSEAIELNSSFNSVLNLLEKTDKKYDLYGFNTEIMPVLINARNISSKDYINLKDNVLNEHTKQANEAFNSGKDTIEYLNVKDPVRANNYGIFNPENIHILGTDEDIRALNEFLKKDRLQNNSSENLINDIQNISNSPDLDTEMNNLEELSSKNLAEEFDNNPEIAKDIFAQMQVLDEVDGKEVSSSHQNYLKGLLDTFVNKSKKFIPEIRVILTDIANDRNGGVMNYTNNTLALYHGNKVNTSSSTLSMQETYVHELIHSATGFVLNLAGKALKEKIYLRKIYEKALKEVKVEDFLPDISLGSEKLDLEYAQRMYDHIFAQKDRIKAFQEFVSMGLTNEAFINKLKSISFTDTLEPSKNIFEAIGNFFNRAMGIFNGVIVGNNVKMNQNLHEALMDVSLKLAKANNEAQTKINERHISLQALFDVLLPLADGKVSKALKASLKELTKNAFKPNMNVIKVFYQAMKELYVTRTDEEADDTIIDRKLRRASDRARILRNVMSKSTIGFNYGGTIQNTLEDMSKPDELLRTFQKFISLANRIDAQRNMIKDSISKGIESEFENKLTQAERESLGYSFNDIDITALDGEYSLNEISKLYSDKNYLTSEETKFTNIVKNLIQKNSDNISKVVSPKQYENYVFNQMNSLANYLVTYESANLAQALNAYNIANLIGARKNPNVSSDLVQAIDKLTTLKSISLLTPSTKEIASRTIDNNPNGVRYLFNSMKVSKRDSLKQLFDGDERNMIKGHSPTIKDNTIDYVIGDLSRTDELVSQGYNLVTRYPNKVNKNVGIFIRKNIIPENKFNRASLRLSQNKAKGTTYREMFNEEYMFKGNVDIEKRYTDAILSTKVAHTKEIDSLFNNESFMGSMEKMPTTIPIYNSKGEVVDFRQIMNKGLRRQLLGFDSDIFNLVSKIHSTTYDKVSSKELNKNIADVLVADYTLYGKDKGKYVDYKSVSLQSKDPDIREFYKLIPDHLAKELEAKMNGEIKIRADIMNRVFGVRSPSITNTKTFRKSRSRVFKLSAILAENILKKIVRNDKVKMVIKTLPTLMGNITSNFYITINLGLNPLESFKLHLEGLNLIKQYRKDVNEFINLRNNKKFGKQINEKRYEFLKRELQSSELKDLIEDGLYNTISEDVDRDKEHKDMFDKFYEEKIYNKMPSWLQTGWNEVMITEKSKVFEVLKEATQYSDFISRYAMYQKLIKKDKVSKKVAIEKVRDYFIDYDIPDSKFLIASNEYGFFMFTKFFLRIQRVLKNDLLLDKPVSTSLMLLLQHLFVDIEDPFEHSIFTKHYERLVYSPLDHISNLAEIPYFDWK